MITSVGLGDRGFRTLELRMVGPCLTGLGLVLVSLRLLLCPGLPCTRGPTHQGDIIMVRPRQEADVSVSDEVRSEEETAAVRQMIEGKSYKARIIVNHQSYNKQAPL